MKLRYDLIPVFPLRELVRTITHGAEKYKDNDWQKSYTTSQIYAKLMRHLEAWRDGHDKDEEGQYNLAAAMFHAMALLWYSVFRPEADDIPERQNRQAEG